MEEVRVQSNGMEMVSGKDDDKLENQKSTIRISGVEERVMRQNSYACVGNITSCSTSHNKLRIDCEEISFSFTF